MLINGTVYADVKVFCKVFRKITGIQLPEYRVI